MGKTIYVDDDAVGANDGSSWTDAYNYLQDALADANSAEKPVEIRVAKGIYKPDQGKNQNPGDRGATFQLINGVTLEGGYASFGELDPHARDIEVYKSILTGDLNGDDVEVRDPCDLLGEPTRSENSYHVATGAGTDETAVLDGFTVTGGNADGKPRRNTGGGMFNASGSPRLKNCVFRRNCSRSNGGGMFIEFDSPTLTNCVFNGNYSSPQGGGLFIHRSNPVLTNCTFTGNFSRIFGGGISCWTSSPELTGCIFSGNIALNGAGGGIYNQDSNPTLLNCTFAGNWGANSNALQLDTFHSPNMVRLANCILWDGGNEIWQWGIYDSFISITHSDVQGGWPGTGNIDVDPLFADPGYWADEDDPNIIVEPNDPNAVWVDGDYHLKSEVGRWDPDSQSWVLDDVTSPCIDAGDPNSDWTAELWPHGERINMGAYGGTQEASMSLSDVYIQWLGHANVKIWTGGVVVYVDSRNLSESLHDATLVLVTHTHGDHYQPADIAKVSGPETMFIAPPDVVQRYGKGEPIAPGQTIEFDCVIVTGVAAYNTNKPNHPKSRNWVGFVIEFGSRRIYVAGDTDLTDEMKALENIDVAILPADGTYTMNAVEAAEATQYIKPELAIPYHWGQNVGTLSDAETFAQMAVCAVKILTVGETISSDNWP
jgi:parallel beta-helix repeat protein